jgi:hypothetical protein
MAKAKIVGKVCAPSCPFCTKEGIFVIVLGFVLMFVLPKEYSWIGLAFIILAYFLPFIKRLWRKHGN